MSKVMTGRCALALACGLALWGACGVALADDPPAALYCGGTHHGYDVDEQLVLGDKRGSRNYGGTHDGYTVALGEDLKVRGSGGIVIRIR